MSTPPRDPLPRYGAAVLAVGVASLLRWPLWPVLGDQYAFLLFWPTVVFVAWYGGLGPGLLSTALSGAAAVFFLLGPPFSFTGSPAEVVGVLIFLTMGAAISVLMEALHRARERAEALARGAAEKRERLRVTLASIGDAVITTDHQGRITFLNPVAAGLTGWDEAGAVGRPLDEVLVIVNEQTREPVESPVARVLREGKVVALANHTAVIARDGAECPVEDSAAPIRDAAGVLTGVVLVFRDVRERRRSRDQIAASERLFRAVIERSYDAIALIGPEGRISYASPSTTRVLGYAPAELTGMNAFDLIHPDDLPQTRDVFARVLGEPGGSATARYRARQKGGAWRWLEGTVTNLLDDPAVAAAVANYRDISAQVEAEGRRDQLLDELARTNRAKDDFLSMLAHELRNPLSPLLNALHILRAAPPSGPVLGQATAMMERQVRHMARLVDDLLDVSRVVRGKIQLRRERVDLARLARTAADDRRLTFEAAGLVLAVGAPETPVWVNGDPTRLAQVVNNLLDNALKFTERGGSVAVRVAAEEAREAVVRVRDTGVGIEAEMLPRIFDTFSQADRSLDRSKGGLGLGLALVRGLAELHGGRVEAQSEGPGRGTEFVVRLPLEAEPPALAHKPTAAAPAAQPLRILVVEDSRDAADSLQMLLGLLGHEVRVAYDGRAGLDQATAWGPDVILSDIGLPGLDGFELARRLRRHLGTAATKLIAVTGYASAEDRERAQASGFDHLLAKPADPAELQSLLGGRQEVRPAAHG